MTTEHAGNGHFVWYEHMTQNPAAAIAFYSDVIGWKTQPFPGNVEYIMWVGSQGPLGGVMKLPDKLARMGVPPNWRGHVQVQDADATCALVKKLGGRIYKEPTDIPTVGRFAVIGDPQDAVIMIFKPNSAMTLHDGSQEGDFCWRELLTSDSAAASAFYAQVFGWRMVHEMDLGAMGIYRIFGIGGKQMGGMMTIPKGAPMPPAWLYYAETPDLDAAIGRATKSGAKVLNGPMEVPGGGRIAQLMDPQGAAFALHQSPKK
ncbi:MAG: VOC family protein [Bryobacterales bacterium]|nr:VOC family protein [Bryobacterales bacterium]